MEHRKRRLRIVIFLGYFILVILAVFIIRFHPVDQFPPLSLTPRPTQTPVSQLAQLVIPTEGFPGIVVGVSKIDDVIIAASDEICIDIEQKPFWKPGDYWEELDNEPKVEISINGVAMTKLRRSSGGVLTFETNEAGEVTGAYGFSVESCFQTEDIALRSQSNIVKVDLVHHTNILYSTSWVLIVNQ